MSVVYLCTWLALIATSALGQEVVTQELASDGLAKAVAEQRGDLLLVSGLQLEGQLRAWLLPRKCTGRRPSDCRAATPLDYSLEHFSGGWTLSIARRGPGQSWRRVRAVAVWCEQCAQAGGASAPSDVPLVILDINGGHKPSRFAAAGKGGSSVALVLSRAEIAVDRQQQPASVARRLQASTCSLIVAGTTHTFDACPAITASSLPFTLYYSLSPAANGGTTLRGGIRVQQSEGWAGWGLNTRQMMGGNVIIAKADSSSSTGASVAGYVLPGSYSASAINAAKGTWVISDAAAQLSNGDLTAVFTVTLSGTVSSLTSSSFYYIWAVGAVSSSSTIYQHDDYGRSSLKLVAPSPAATASPSPPPPSPVAASPPPPSPSAASLPLTAPSLEQAQPSPSPPPPAKASAQQVSACSLTVAGTAYPFDGCPAIVASSLPFTLYYSLSPAANGGTTFRGGFRVQQSLGWAGWGLNTYRMMGSNVVIAKADSSSSTGASVAGSTLPQSYLAGAVNAALGNWAISNAAAELSNGNLAAVFTVTLPASVSSLTTQPFSYIWAVGTVSSGTLRQHQDWGGDSLTLAPPSSGSTHTTSPMPDASPAAKPPTPPPSPSPVPAPPSTPAPVPATPVGGTSQSCALALPGGSTQAFPYCASVSGAVDSALNIMWRVLPSASGSRRRLHQAAGSTSPVLFALNGTTQGASYISLGFPVSPGSMAGASAFVLQDCDSCPSGAKLQDFYLGGYDSSSVTPPSRLTSSNFSAVRTIVNGQTWLSASFEVELDNSLLAAPETNIILAVGPITSSGALLQHDSRGDVYVSLSSGGVGSINSGSSTATKKAIHAWLMVVSWGVLIPAGIVMARCFKELDLVWFQVHRAVQSLAFLTAVAGFVLGFYIRESWETPYTVHRNLGVAVMALATVQMTALFVRPLKTSVFRPYWDFYHWWAGRAAAACAIGNIYYGMLHVDKLGTWAWATYTAVLCVIVAVAVVKDSMDYYRGMRKVGIWSTNGPKRGQDAFIVKGTTGGTSREGTAPSSIAGSDTNLAIGPNSHAYGYTHDRGGF